MQDLELNNYHSACLFAREGKCPPVAIPNEIYVLFARYLVHKVTSINVRI